MMKPYQCDDHARRYLYQHCVCLRPYLYRQDGERGVWRCAICGGIRFQIQNNNTSQPNDNIAQLKRERNAALLLAIILLSLLIVLHHIYASYTAQLQSTLDNLLATR